MREKLRRGLFPQPVGINPELQQAAVLVLLDKLEPGAEVVLTQRANHMRLHPGEIAFPGGRCDADDPHHWATALREAEEEIDLDPAAVQRLGMLPPLVTRSEIQVTPCVGVLARPVPFRVNPEEVESIFNCPLDYCARPGILEFEKVKYRERLRKVPRIDYQQYTIWGITAAMLVLLVNLACDAGLELDDYLEEKQR
jgi:8-oxo-dGTP pyrophosphatase MutT (NUDIX family)